MSQKRYTDFGSLRSAEQFNAIVKNLTKPGILQGGSFSIVGSDKVHIAPITLVTENGVIISESETQIITVTNTSSAKNYTIYYEHINSEILGGSKATLLVKDGHSKQSDLANAVVIGYVKYPGGSVPLATSHLYSPANIALDSNKVAEFSPAETRLPPFETKWIPAAPGSPFSMLTKYDTTQFLSYTQLENAGSSVTTHSFYLPGFVYKEQAGLVSLYVDAEFGASVVVKLVASTGTVISDILSTSINNTSGFKLYNLIFANNSTDFVKNKPYTIRLDITLNAGKKIKFAAIGSSVYNLPFI